MILDCINNTQKLDAWLAIPASCENYFLCVMQIPSQQSIQRNTETFWVVERVVMVHTSDQEDNSQGCPTVQTWNECRFVNKMDAFLGQE